MKKAVRFSFVTLFLLKVSYGITQKPNDLTKQLGEKTYLATCQGCHTDVVGSKAPSKLLLSGMTPRAIYSALKTGKMRQQAETLSDDQCKAIAQWLTDRTFQETNLPKEAFTTFSLPKNVAYFSGWGGNPAGTGFTATTQITPDNVANLKVKWTFAFPEATIVRSKPAVVGEWLIVGSQFGEVYAIHQKTGKIGWQFKGDAAIRGAIYVYNSRKGLGIYFADFATNVYALDAKTGKLMWKKRAGEHPLSAVTGSVVVHQDRIIIPLTSGEINSTKDPNYACCTSSGEVVALNVNTGDFLWRHRVVSQAATVQGKKKNGEPFYGPSGAPVWCSPTIDEKRGFVYIGTGENYTDPPSTTSDAIQAIELKTGKLAWSFQATPNDAWNLACPGEPNCPEKSGPDFDFGMAPLLVNYGGKDMLVAGQKSGVVHALDPATGKILWQTRIGKGGFLGGIHWGMATDGKYVYAANSDNIYAIDPRDKSLKATPGIYALDLADGKVAWYQPTPSCAGKKGCIVSNSAAPLVVPGLVFAGSLEGTIRAYDTQKGTIVWQYDTAKEYESSNGIKGVGGAIDGPSPVAAGNMLFVNSGYGMFGEMAGNVLIAFELTPP
ncbi:PQQ-binding-like beta-propeller repeat protein [Runella sp.]|uniref:outer membrane protein assembly factor BamB family protein n=1 Tax=Runella sp. TaxID=1960881 RepID=UPI003D0AA4A1